MSALAIFHGPDLLSPSLICQNQLGMEMKSVLTTDSSEN